MNVVLGRIESDLTYLQRIRLAMDLNVRRNGFLVIGSVVLILTFLSSFVLVLIESYTGLSEIFGQGVTNGIFIGIPALILLFLKEFIKRFYSVMTHPVTSRIITSVRLPDYKRLLAPVHEMIKDINVLLKHHRRHTRTNRWVVFIDEIDRCHPNAILEFLEAVKHFLDVKGFVFVVAMDSRIVRRAIGRNYNYMGAGKEPEERFGSLYLEKIQQISFRLPQLSEKRIMKLTKSLLDPFCNASETNGLSAGDVTMNHEDEERREGNSRPDQPSERKSVTGNDANLQGPNAEDTLKQEFTIKPIERETFLSTIAESGLELSPRAITRFLNVYLIARHLQITRARRDLEDCQGSRGPNRHFVGWLLLTMTYPLVSAAMVRWFESTNWELSPVNYIFDENGRIVVGKEDEVIGKVNTFQDASNSELKTFASAFMKMKLKHREIWYYREITACFNVMLD